MTTFGIIGAGNIGGQVARAVLGLGHTVLIANSRGPETLSDLVEDLGDGASAVTAEEAAERGEVVLVAVPLKAYQDVPVEPLTGKIVLDANNYYFERDGHIGSLDAGEATTSGLLQEHLPGAKVVKAFSHIVAAQINTDGKPAGTPGRRALVVSSDHPDAARYVVDLYDQLGFDAVEVTPLSESWRVERDQPAYVVAQDKDELTANLALATRTGSA